MTDKDVSPPPDLVAQVKAHYDNDRLTEASDALDQASASGLAPASVAYWRGMILSAGGHVDDAREHFDSAHRLDPHFSKPLYALGRLAELRGNAVDAMYWYQRCLLEEPTHGGAQNGVRRLGAPMEPSPRQAEPNVEALTPRGIAAPSPPSQADGASDFINPREVWLDRHRAWRSHRSAQSSILLAGLAAVATSTSPQFGEWLVTWTKETLGAQEAGLLIIALGNLMYDQPALPAILLLPIASCLAILATISSRRTRYVVTDVSVRTQAGVLVPLDVQMYYYEVVNVIFDRPFPTVLLNTGRITVVSERAEALVLWGTGSTTKMSELAEDILAAAAAVRGDVKKTFR
ncbi:MAG: hypothetical protein QM711_13910 [Micropruina sp.]|uniref:tetratricopeptide repeat protein n=1 Tax=Micropruina sp. TaxID=2737536 RepID=UPI0039E665A4